MQELFEQGRLEELMIAATALVPEIVRTAIHRTPSAAYLEDDLVGEGNAAIVVACQRLPPNLDNVGAYLSRVVQRAVAEMITGGESIASARTQRRHATPRTVSLQDEVAESVAAPSDQCATLMDEILNGCCEDSLDRDIVTLRADGRTDSECAALIGVSESTVQKRRKAIERRFVSRNNEYALSA